MATIIFWDLEINPKNQHLFFEKSTVVGDSPIIIKLSNIHRRFQAIKHGTLPGQVVFVIEVSDDITVEEDQSQASWIPQGIIKIDNAAATVDFNGTTVIVENQLTCGYASQVAWKYVRARMLENNGDPATLIMGL